MEATHTAAECFSCWHRIQRRPDDLYCYRECSRVSLPPVSARIASICKRADEFLLTKSFIIAIAKTRLCITDCSTMHSTDYPFIRRLHNVSADPIAKAVTWAINNKDLQNSFIHTRHKHAALTYIRRIEATRSCRAGRRSRVNWSSFEYNQEHFLRMCRRIVRRLSGITSDNDACLNALIDVISTGLLGHEVKSLEATFLLPNTSIATHCWQVRRARTHFLVVAARHSPQTEDQARE